MESNEVQVVDRVPANADEERDLARDVWMGEFVRRISVPGGESKKTTKLLDLEGCREMVTSGLWLSRKLKDGESCYLGQLMNQVFQSDAGMRLIVGGGKYPLKEHDEARRKDLFKVKAGGDLGPFFGFLGMFYQDLDDLADSEWEVDDPLSVESNDLKFYEVSRQSVFVFFRVRGRTKRLKTLVRN